MTSANDLENPIPDQTAENPVAEAPTMPATGSDAPHAARSVEASALEANLSAIARATTGELEAAGSALGFTKVNGDATITASAAPLVYAKGDVDLRQCYTSAVLAGGDMHISQSGAPMIVGKSVSIDRGAGVLLAAGEAEVTNGFVGVVLAPKTTLSGDAKVLVSTRSALIVAAGLLGGFALGAAMLLNGVRGHRGHRPHHMPQMAERLKHLELPDFARIAEQARQRMQG